MAKKTNPPGELRPVTTQAIIKRLRRHFAAQNEVFHVARNEKERQLWGDYYVTAGRFNVIIDQLPYLDLAARRLGVLKDDEELIDPRHQPIYCRNCNARADRRWVNDMRERGFSLWHLACPSCGQHRLTDEPLGGRHE